MKEPTGEAATQQSEKKAVLLREHGVVGCVPLLRERALKTALTMLPMQ